MSDNNGYVNEWVPGPDGGMMHIYYDPNLDMAPELDTPNDEENDANPPCDLWGHAWQHDTNGNYYCIRCGEEQF